jgi:hypothetical protein
MAYYGRPSWNRGDYYRGDYYRGDPGLFSFLGRAVKGIAGAALGFLGGGPVGAVLGAGEAVASGGMTAEEMQATGPRGLTASELTALHQRDARLRAVGRLRSGPSMPGGALPFPPGGMALMPHPGMGMMVRRQHPNKSTYVTRGGGTSRWPVGLNVHPKGTELVTSRRMNVGNARALRRALRRARGFAKLAHKVLRVTRQFKGKGFGGGVRRLRKR